MRKIYLFTTCLILSLLAANSRVLAQSFITAAPGTDICSGTSVTFTTSFSGVDTFQWMVNSTLVSTDTAYTTSGLNNGDTVKCMVIAGGDTSSDAIIMTVHVTPPMPGAIFGPSAVCVDGTATLTDTVTGGVWTSNNATATISPAAVVTGVSAGLDTLFYTVTNACGSNMSGFIIHIDTPVTATAITISGTPTYCTGTTITLNEAATDGVWSSSNSTIATVDAAGSVSAIHSGADTIMYTITNGCGSDTATLPLLIQELPHAGTITGDTSVCRGTTTTLADTAPGGVWSSTNAAFAPVSATGVVTGIVYGSTIIAYTVTNACGVATDSFHMNVDIPVLPILGSNTLCQFTLGILIDPLPGGTWSTDNILIAGPAIDGALFGLLPGTATITYTLINACGTTSTTFEVTVAPCSNEVTNVAATETALNVFPNPNTGAFTLHVSSATDEAVQVQVTNMLGEKIKELSIATNKETPLTLDAPAGIYFLTAKTANQQLTSKIVVAK